MKRDGFIGTVCALLAGLAALGLSSCKEQDLFQLRFNHAVHLKEAELACNACHGAVTNGMFQRAGHDQCVQCHDEVKSDKVSRETCGMCHKQKDLDKIADTPRLLAVGRHEVFKHTPALSNQCADCHGNIILEERDFVPQVQRDRAARRMLDACAEGVSCSECHENMDPNVVPRSHGLNWVRLHGSRSRRGDAVCAGCHQEDSCKECHRGTLPASHNSQWRLKTHGIEAAWDRQKCATCHEEDSCVACHSEVRPSSHNASWKSTHCLNCHTSSADGTGCAVCHVQGISGHVDPHPAGWRSSHCNRCHNNTEEGAVCDACHASAAGGRHPNPHNGTWRTSHCSSCHLESVSSECGSCHSGAESMSRHPNPHGAGWRGDHCNQCHSGDPSSGTCEYCHPKGDVSGLHNGFWPATHNLFPGADCTTCH